VGLVYIAINLLLLILAPYDVHLSQGADASSWYNPALSLLKHGAFVTLENPTIVQTYRPPLYPMYEALMLFIGNGNIISIVIGQIILLWFTGVMTFKMVESILPGKGKIGLILVIFNPSALGTAHLVQSDILYMFMVSATLYYLLSYISNRKGVKITLLVGLLFGLTCLVRPSGQYLIPLLPFIYVIIGLLKKSGQSLSMHFFHGLLSAIIAVSVVFPWAQHNASAGWGYNLATDKIKETYFRDNVIYLESILSDISINDATRVINNEQNYMLSYTDKLSHTSEQEKSIIVASYYKNKLLTYDYKIVVKGFIDSWIGFFGAGGATNLHNILALDGNRSVHIMAESEKHVSRVDATLAILLESNLATIVISLLSFVYVIVLRVFGLIGLINMIKDREYGVLFILSGIVTYFVFIALFVGNSRYRLPVEPALIIMAVYGFSAVIKKMVYVIK
jgi:4-amino-4-deoxy-L-arabinose transferase-like glycosyltransferase